MVQASQSDFSSSQGRLVGHLRATVSALLLGGTLLVTNLAQTLSLLIRPLSLPFFRSFNRFCAGSWWGLGRWWAEGLYGIRLEYRGDDVPVAENAMVICNHQCMTDIVFLWSIAWRKRRIGDLKFVVKHALKYVPGIGWGMLFLDCLFLKRNWEEDQALVKSTFSKFSQQQIPLWLISFSEGTRLTAEKLELAQKFASGRGVPVPENVLVPRTKGFTAAVTGLRHYVTAVYDITIAYPDGVPSLWQLVQGRVKRGVMHVTRYPIESLPMEKEALADWLKKRFEEKDKLLPVLIASAK